MLGKVNYNPFCIIISTIFLYSRITEKKFIERLKKFSKFCLYCILHLTMLCKKIWKILDMYDIRKDFVIRKKIKKFLCILYNIASDNEIKYPLCRRRWIRRVG